MKQMIDDSVPMELRHFAIAGIRFSRLTSTLTYRPAAKVERKRDD
jgi:hypothetical protein